MHNFKNVWTSDGKMLYKDGWEKLRYIMINTI